MEAVKAGRGFVTNGPIVEFDVAGSEPGDVVEFQGRRQVKARARVRSVLPINTIDIVMNGRKVRQPASIAYLQKYVEGPLHWLSTNPNFAREEDRRAARQAAEQALQVCKDL